MIKYIFSFVIMIFFFSCKEKQRHEIEAKQEIKFNYIKNLQLYTTDSSLVLKYTNDAYELQFKKSELPLQRIILFSSSAVGYIENLHALSSVVGVYDSQWMYSPQLHRLISERKVKDLGNSSVANIENILNLHPQGVITFQDPNKAKLMQNLKKQGIKIIYIDEYLEKTPLAKAEYIKIFGFLLGRESKSDSLFSTVEKRYGSLKNKAKIATNRPTVFVNNMLGDTWYMSGGKSFNAAMIKDAGGKYLWDDNEENGSLALSFEQVYTKAKNAKYWINVSNFNTYQQLSAAYKNNERFYAFQQKKVYNNNKRQTEQGTNDIYENGTVHPDQVLADLIAIFHPEILPNHHFFFYQPLQ